MRWGAKAESRRGGVQASPTTAAAAAEWADSLPPPACEMDRLCPVLTGATDAICVRRVCDSLLDFLRDFLRGVLRGSLVGSTQAGNPFNTGRSPLNYSSNPGVNCRISQGCAWPTWTRRFLPVDIVFACDMLPKSTRQPCAPPRSACGNPAVYCSTTRVKVDPHAP